MVNDKVSLMFGVHVDDIIVSGKSDVYHEFSELKQRFPVKHQGSSSCTPTVHSNVIGRTES